MRRPGSRAPRQIGVALLAVLLVVTVALLRHHFTEPMEDGSYRATFSNTNEWLALGGSWSQRSGEVINTAEERGAKLIRRHGPRADYQVESDVQMDDPLGDAGLILRSDAAEEGVDSYRGYLAVIKPSEGLIEFGRADFGWQLLARQYFTAPVDTSGWIHLHVVAVGCTFLFQVTLPEGSTISTRAEDPTCLVAGRTGLRSSLTSARWRNLRIQPANEQQLEALQATIPPGHASPTSDHPDIDPSPASIDRYLAAMRREAMKHVLPQNFQYIGDLVGPPGRRPDVTIVGTVISTPPLLIVQDYSGSIVVSDYDAQPVLKLGDMVEVHGTLALEGLGRHIERTNIRVLWSDIPAPPLAVTASQLTDGSYRGRAITVEGTLLSSTSKPDGYELILADQNYVFLAVGSEDFHIDLSRLQPGSRLRLRGAATVFDRFTQRTYPFAIIMDRVDLLSGPPWWSMRHLLWLFAALLAIFASLLLFMHLLQQWRMRSVLQEREQLALDMHDTLAQSFTGIGYQLQAASQERRGEQQIQEHIRSALQMVKLSHKEASRTIASLRPQYRDAAAIVESLKEGAERLIDGGDLHIDASLGGPNLILPLAVTDAFFRIGQEAVSNAIQHGRCHTLTIRLEIGRKQACLTIADDGTGFDIDAAHEGLGLVGMKCRATTAKIEFEIHSAAEHGTTVQLRARHSATDGLRHATLSMFKGLWNHGVL